MTTHSEHLAAVITAVRARLRGEELPHTLTDAHADLMTAMSDVLAGADTYHLAEIGAAAMQELHAALFAQAEALAAVTKMQRDAEQGPPAGATH